MNDEFVKNCMDMWEQAPKINNKTTNFFNYIKGVQQGNPLSPLLFNLYINGIFEFLKNNRSLTLDGQKYFNAYVC